jgi:tetratricopeptide (TPR) repeat protein
LKKQFKISHPAVVEVMESLAEVYYKLDRDKEAELISRQLVDIYRQTLGSNNYKTLRACVSVIDCIIGQGDWLKAQAMCQDLRRTIIRFAQPDDPLAIEIAGTEAWLASGLRDDDTAERIHRELLQIHLTSSGPKHVDSIDAMRGLGSVIARRSLKEGEILLQTAVHLSLENPIQDDTQSCGAMEDLARALYRRNAYGGESLRIATLAMERFTPSLGIEHPEILRVRGQRAWIMAYMGKLIESEKLFRVVVSVYSREGRSTSEALDAWHGLAHVLLKMGQKDEAIAWNKKIFEFQLSRSGASHPDMRGDCNHLGDIYEERGRYGEALKLYHKMIDKIRESGEDPNGAITEFETRISDVKEQMEHSTNPPSTEDDSSDWESGSDGGESDEEPDDKSDGEPKKSMDEEASEQTGQEEESELETMDWTAFVHEDFLMG